MMTGGSGEWRAAFQGVSDESLVKPDHGRGSDHHLPVVGIALREPRRDAARLLEPIDPLFHDVVPPVNRVTEG